MATREWILKQNCSISPRQLAKAYAALCTGSLLVATYFTFHGAWMVMVFAVLELAGVAAAFLYFGRHATDRELIALNDACLLIELVRAEQTKQFKLDPLRTQVKAPVKGRGLIGLVANGERVEVGRFLTQWRRRELARELSRELGSHRSACGLLD